MYDALQGILDERLTAVKNLTDVAGVCALRREAEQDIEELVQYFHD
jgi:hypothetical protein